MEGGAQLTNEKFAIWGVFDVISNGGILIYPLAGLVEKRISTPWFVVEERCSDA